MTENMLKFVDHEQETPVKRVASKRTGDFHEIYADYITAKAEMQAARCSQCGVPFCQVHCPLHNNIPDWLKLTAEGRLQEAYDLSSATNSMPEICGRICPQDRLCEGNCVIEQSGHGAVTIGAVERYITDTAWEKGWVKEIKPLQERSQSVGIIGAGPAGMAAAEALRLQGYQVHIYDRYDRAGGLLIYGIPGFKLEKSIVERRSKRLVDSGIVFHQDFEVGRDASLAQIRAKHDAVLVATGVYKARDIRCPGVGASGLHQAMTYLTASNRKGMGDMVEAFESGELNAQDKHVVVIGGGGTAMDCVRTAVRQGAKSVKCLYRRDRANMPGSMREVTNAEEEGVEFIWQTAPKAFQTGKQDQITGVKAIRMRLGAPDASGRQSPVEITGSEFTEKADLVLTALGFLPEDLLTLFDAPELPVTDWGTIQTDFKTGATALEGVYAAGDIVRGASLVVWAIKDGLDAADAIHKFI